MGGDWIMRVAASPLDKVTETVTSGWALRKWSLVEDSHSLVLDLQQIKSCLQLLSGFASAPQLLWGEHIFYCALPPKVLLHSYKQEKASTHRLKPLNL